MAEELRFVNTASTPGGDGTTNTTTGATRAYASKNEWEGAEQKDLVAAGNTHRVVCEGTANDTTAVIIDGWTTGAANFIESETDRAAAAGTHMGFYDPANHYSLVVDTSFAPVIDVLEDFVRIRRLQVANNDSAAQTGGGVFYSGSGEFHLSHNIIVGVGVNPKHGMEITNITATIKVWNNLFQDWGVEVSGTAWRIIANSGTITGALYNNTIVDSASSLSNVLINGAGTSVVNFFLKNNIMQDAGGGTNLDIGITNTGITGNSFNVTEDDTGRDQADIRSAGFADADTLNHLIDASATFITNGVRVGNIVRNTTDGVSGIVTVVNSETDLTLNGDTFPLGTEVYQVYKNSQGAVVFKDEGSNNFLLGAADTVARNQGTDLTTDPDGQLNVTDDILGNPRPQGSAFDVGFHELRVMVDVLDRHYPRGVVRGLTRGVA